MRQIELTRGRFTLVSNIDFAYLNQWKWYALKIRESYYAVRDQYRGINRKTILMHRVILIRKLKYTTFKQVDHIDGDGLNNLRSNLRMATNLQNQFNKPKQKNNKLGYKGIGWSNKYRVKYMARICFNKVQIYLGSFESKIEAAKAYNKAAKRYFGKFARLNKV